MQAIQPLVFRLGACGIQVESFLRDQGVDPACIYDPDGRVRLVHLDRLWENAASLAGDDCFGLHAAEHINPYTFGLISYLGVTSHTMGDGLRRVCSFFPLFSDGSDYRLEVGDGSATLTAAQHVVGGTSIRQRSEFTIAVVFRYAQKYVARAWSPFDVFFMHDAPSRIDEHRRIFKAPVRFGQARMGFQFAGDLLAEPLKTAHSPQSTHFLRVVNDVVTKTPISTDFVARVRETIVASLQHGRTSLREVAQALGVSSRSMQRRLERHGCSYQLLFDQVRRDVATSMLARSDVSVVEVGFLLGFSEPATFYRAFKRWTGTTPVVYRRTACRSKEE